MTPGCHHYHLHHHIHRLLLHLHPLLHSIPSAGVRRQVPIEREARAMVQSRIKAIARMEVVAETLADPTLCFDFPPPEPLSGLPILQLADVGFNYPGQPNLFKNVNLGVDLNSRVALVGPNGIGKSTLLKLVLGDLEPVAGAVHRHGKLRLGRFSQHHVDQLDLSLTALEHFSRCWPQAKPLEIRAHLGTMGMGGNLSHCRRCPQLSGGQKSRVAFAQIMWQKPHLLLLDEPTNHLDLDAVEALIQAPPTPPPLTEGSSLSPTTSTSSHPSARSSGSPSPARCPSFGTPTPRAPRSRRTESFSSRRSRRLRVARRRRSHERQARRFFVHVARIYT